MSNDVSMMEETHTPLSPSRLVQLMPPRKRRQTTHVPTDNEVAFIIEATECIEPDKFKVAEPQIKLKDFK